MAPRTHVRGMMTAVMLVGLLGGTGLMMSAMLEDHSDGASMALTGPIASTRAPPGASDAKQAFPEYYADQDPAAQEEMVRSLRPWPEVYNYGLTRPADPLAALLAQEAADAAGRAKGTAAGGGASGEGDVDFASVSRVPAAAAGASPSLRSRPTSASPSARSSSSSSVPSSSKVGPSSRGAPRLE